MSKQMVVSVELLQRSLELCRENQGLMMAQGRDLDAQRYGEAVDMWEHLIAQGRPEAVAVDNAMMERARFRLRVVSGIDLAPACVVEVLLAAFGTSEHEVRFGQAAAPGQPKRVPVHTWDDSAGNPQYEWQDAAPGQGGQKE